MNVQKPQMGRATYIAGIYFQGLQLTSLRIQPFLLAPCRQGRFVLSWQNVLSGKKQGETAVFAGYQLTWKNSHGIIGLYPMEE